MMNPFWHTSRPAKHRGEVKYPLVAFVCLTYAANAVFPSLWASPIDNLHGAPAEHEGRPDHDGVAQLLLATLMRAAPRWSPCRPGGCLMSSLVRILYHLSRSSASSMLSGDVPQIAHVAVACTHAKLRVLGACASIEAARPQLG